MQDTSYLRSRYNWERLKETVIHFYRRHGLIVYDPWLFKQLEIPYTSQQETINYFKHMLNKNQPGGRVGNQKPETSGQKN